MFAHDVRAKREGLDPLHAFKTSIPWAAHDLEPLQHTHFIVGRGCWITFSSQSEHILDNTEYAYVVWFDRYINFGSHLAWLVPKKIITDKIAGTSTPYVDYLGPIPDAPDLNERDLTPEGLEGEANLRGLPILKLSLSALSGGLCNAYPSNRAPHFEREQGVEGTRDRSGHLHKSYFLGGYRFKAPPELLDILRYYEELHYSVERVITSLQNRISLLRIAIALGNRGLTGRRELQDSDEESDGGVYLQNGGFRPQTHSRMLEWVYLQHAEFHKNPQEKERPPVVKVCRALNYRKLLPSPVLIDPIDLTITTLSDNGAQQIHHLPRDGDGRGRRELGEWNRIVVPHFFERGSGKVLLDNDIRPFPRT